MHHAVSTWVHETSSARCICFGMMAMYQIVGVRRRHDWPALDNSTGCGIATRVPPSAAAFFTRQGMKPAAFEYQAPATLRDAIDLLASDSEATVIAGGQSLMPVLAFRLAAPSMLVDLRRVPGLGNIAVDDNGVRLGARVRWCDIEDDQRLETAHPLLQGAIAHVGYYQIRNRGTVGDSLAHADPAAELPGIAVTCEAEITLIGAAGARTVPAGEFFTGPLSTLRQADEIITELRLPPWPRGRRWAFQEFALRHGDFALGGMEPECVMRVNFRLNGNPVAVDVEPRMHLADCLRDVLRQTGTHLGCEHGVCGACTVIVEGEAVRSCLMLAVQADGSTVVTVEGLSTDDALTPLQTAFRKHHALQCGFCTPGMLTTAHALLTEEPDADVDRIRSALSGNLCRCTGYIPIVEAVLEARAAYQRDGKP